MIEGKGGGEAAGDGWERGWTPANVPVARGRPAGAGGRDDLGRRDLEAFRSLSQLTFGCRALFLSSFLSACVGSGQLCVCGLYRRPARTSWPERMR